MIHEFETDADLYLKNISLGRNDRPILENVSLAFTKGNLYCLKGPNGIGKTSLLRLIAGFIPATSGQLLLGTKIWAPFSGTLPTCYIGQPFGFHPNLSGYDNLALIAAMRATSMPTTDPFQIAGFASQPVRTLSSGQLQRLALSQLMIKSPTGQAALWLLDEPNNTLDAASLSILEEVIENHLKEGGRIIASLHQALCGYLSPHLIELDEFAPRHDKLRLA